MPCMSGRGGIPKKRDRCSKVQDHCTTLQFPVLSGSGGSQQGKNLVKSEYEEDSLTVELGSISRLKIGSRISVVFHILEHLSFGIGVYF